MPKNIDYLSEDRPISGQSHALISIVGPNYKAKCDVFGIKIRGVGTLQECKKLSARIMEYDDSYDIFTVDVGKFFPLEVDPNELKDVQYSDERLNKLIKGYLENREKANDHFEHRKNQMMKDAIREGKNQEELQQRREHPISVMTRMNNQKEKIKQLEEDLENTRKDLELTNEKYASYTPEEINESKKELDSSLTEQIKNSNEELSIDDIKRELLGEEEIKSNISTLKELDSQLEKLNKQLSEIDIDTSPNSYSGIKTKIDNLQFQRQSRISELNKEDVNKFINSNFTGDSYSVIQKNVEK